MRRTRSTLQFEFLESRVLLSGVDTPSDLSAAIQTTDSHINVNLDVSGTVLKISGPDHGSLSLDLGQLPASIVDLQISSFDSVTLVGEHDVSRLVVSDIRLVDAGRISISDALGAFGVEQIRIDQAPLTVVLEGSAGMGSVGSRTLLEVGQFSSSPDAQIIAWVQSLGLATTSHVENLPQIATSPETQSIFLNFQPENQIHASTLAVSVIEGGDFASYFLASPAERSGLEQSLIVARQSVQVDFVPAATILSDPAVQAALSEIPESGFALTKANFHPLADADQAALRSAMNANLVQNNTPIIADDSSGSGVHALKYQSLLDNLTPNASSQSSEFAAQAISDSDALTLAALRLVTFEINEASHAADRFGDAVSNAVHTAATRLGEPLTQLVSDLRTHLTTFGEMVSARVTDHLKVDHQSPLLVDARPIRQSNEPEILVVTV